MYLQNHNNEQITQEDKKIPSFNNQIPKEIYQWYNWENRASYNNLPENSYPGTPGLRATPTATN